MSLPREEVVNTLLADLLNKKVGIQAFPENQQRRPKRFDVYLVHRTIPFVLEASYDETDAKEDALKRLNEGLIDTASIAIHYNEEYFNDKNLPEEIRNVIEAHPLKLKVFTSGKDVSGTLLEYIYSSKRTKAEEKSGWIYFQVSDFSILLDSAIELIIREDIVGNTVNKIERSTDSFVEIFKRTLKHAENKKKVMSDLYNLLYSPLVSSKEETEDLNVPEEVIISNLYLTLLFSAVLYDASTTATGLHSIEHNLRLKNGNVLRTLSDCFEDILKVDYTVIFELSKKIVDYLFDLQSSMELTESIKELTDLSSDILSNHAVLRQDFVGKLYHKITGDIATRKGYATFFTKIPIASFLATLVMESKGGPSEHDFGDLAELQSFRVGDLACGSGTLLSAIYNSILAKHIKDTIKSESIDIPGAHRVLIEKVLWGIDALSNSVQIASIVESLHNASVKMAGFNNLHIPVDSSGSLGSLNLWYSSDLLEVHVADFDVKKTGIKSVPMFDAIIMNPPFSRNTAPGKTDSRPRMFDFIVDRKGYEKLSLRYSKLIKEMTENLLINKKTKRNGKFKRKKGLFNSIYDQFVGDDKVFSPRGIAPINAGAALPFIFLADKYLKENGRIGLVLPKTVIESSSYFLVRALFGANYSIEYIITSEEKGNSNFSYSTNLSEILLVARKSNSSSTEKPTTIVRLMKQPQTQLEGILLARSLLAHDDSLTGMTNSNIETFEVENGLLMNFLWSLSIFTNLPAKVAMIVLSVIDGEFFSRKVKLVSFNEMNEESPIFSILDSRPLRGGNLKKMFPADRKGKMNVVTECGREQMRKMRANDASFGKVSSSSPDSVQFFKARSGHIIIPSNVRFNTFPLFATYSEKSVASTEPFIGRAETEQQEKALVVWLNNSIAVSLLRTTFSTVESLFGHLRMWQVKSLWFPDVRDKKVASRLAEVWEKYKDVSWNALPEQFNDAVDNEDSVRRRYDLAVMKAIDPDINLNSVNRKLTEIYIGMRNLLSGEENQTSLKFFETKLPNEN